MAEKRDSVSQAAEEHVVSFRGEGQALSPEQLKKFTPAGWAVYDGFIAGARWARAMALEEAAQIADDFRPATLDGRSVGDVIRERAQ